jgi:hypothetical protein
MELNKYIMTQFDILLWLVSGLIAILSFIGALGVNALMKMSRDLNDIKTMVMVQDVKHDSLERRVEQLEHKK